MVAARQLAKDATALGSSPHTQLMDLQAIVALPNGGGLTHFLGLLARGTTSIRLGKSLGSFARSLI